MAEDTAVKTKQRSYFQKDVVHRHVLDDGESFIEHKKLDEGTFQAYQDITSKIKLDRTGDTTEIDMRVGEQRRFLVENLVTNWNLVDENEKPIKYSASKLLELPPHVIGNLVEDIYRKNEILAGETSDEAGK